MQYKWTVLTVTSVGVLMSGIDSRILIVGLPQVATSLHADAEQAIWFSQAYVFGSTVALLVIGRVTDMIGRVKIYNVGFAIFTLGSLFTSLSLAPALVILFRGVQGLGAAMLTTNSTALIVDVADKKNLGLMLGINQLAFRAGTLSALTLSGVILSLLDWRALFYINIPIGVFGTYWAHRRLKETAPNASLRSRSSMDWVGFVTFTVAIASLLLGLTYSAYESPGDFTVGPLFVVSLASFAVFVVQERRKTNVDPMLDIRLLRIRQFTGGSLALLLNSICWGAVLVLLSLYFQLVRGLSPLQAGLSLIPFEVAYLLSGAPSGKFSDKYGRRPFMIAGLAIQGLAVYLFSTLTISDSFYNVAVYMVLFGAGSGLFTSPNTSSIMGSVPPEMRGVASATSSIFWNVGYTISLNLAVVLMATVVPYHLISGMISSSSFVANSSGPTGIGGVDRTLFLGGLHQAYFWLALLNFIAILPSMLREKSPRAGGP